MPVRTCERCGAPFYVQYACRPNRYCGYSCSNAVNVTQRRDRRKPAAGDTDGGES